MGMMENARMLGNKAYGAIKAGMTQARTYNYNDAMVGARATASKLANSSWTSSKSLGKEFVGGMRGGNLGMHLAGTAAGGALGVGYDTLTNRNSDWRSKMKAGAYGGLAGGLSDLAYDGGRSAMKMAGRRGITGSSIMAGAKSLPGRAWNGMNRGITEMGRARYF